MRYWSTYLRAGLCVSWCAVLWCAVVCVRDLKFLSGLPEAEVTFVIDPTGFVSEGQGQWHV